MVSSELSRVFLMRSPRLLFISRSFFIDETVEFQEPFNESEPSRSDLLLLSSVTSRPSSVFLFLFMQP
ncbi:hypothetical protein DNTS_014805, partial [Danionella cerebrum]